MAQSGELEDALAGCALIWIVGAVIATIGLGISTRGGGEGDGGGPPDPVTTTTETTTAVPTTTVAVTASVAVCHPSYEAIPPNECVKEGESYVCVYRLRMEARLARTGEHVIVPDEIRVVGHDEYRLDPNGDGLACNECPEWVFCI